MKAWKERSIECLFEIKERDRIARYILGEEGWIKWQEYITYIQQYQSNDTNIDLIKKEKAGN